MSKGTNSRALAQKIARAHRLSLNAYARYARTPGTGAGLRHLARHDAHEAKLADLLRELDE